MNRYTSGPAAKIARRADTVFAEKSVENQMRVAQWRTRHGQKILQHKQPSPRDWDLR